MIARHLQKVLQRAARQYTVVTVTGPRQSGKTTLAQAAFPRHEYVSLENPEERTFALEDPKGFLNRLSSRVILDEVQRVPDLFSYIQGIVDRQDRPGQFILTGSQNFLLLQRISQSLAGRCAVLHLLPFSRAELVGKPIMDPGRLKAKKQKKQGVKRADSEHLFEMLFTGFYPRIHDKHLEPQNWLANYYQTYLERDVRDLLHVGDIETFGRFVRLCAGRCGQLLNLSSLAADAGISHTTARRWLSMLEASFIVFLLRPHHRNFNKRLVKSPKLYFIDTGLLCYLLRIHNPDELAVHASRGSIFEAWAISELLKSFHHSGQVPDIYFWRDSTGHEVDILIDRGTKQVPIEVKSGQTIGSDFFKEINYWRSLAGQSAGPAALIYGGESSYMRQGTMVTSWQDWG
jgi:uncharacterized protein